MRQYAALWDNFREVWSVIAADDTDGYWFVYTPDAGDQAKEIANALNAKEAS